MNANNFLCQLNIFNIPKPPKIKGISGTITPNTVNNIHIRIETFGIFQAITNAPGGKTSRTKKRFMRVTMSFYEI